MFAADHSFSEIAHSLGLRINAALEARLNFDAGCPTRLREAMHYCLLSPGKRFRPILALLAAEACGGTMESALPAACALEMVHAYSLIHDDLPALDNDDLRRGRPTCHKAFDEATAILAGDALLTLAFEVIAGEVRPPEVAAACCAVLAKAAGACNMVGGQMDDLLTERRGWRNVLDADAAQELLRSIHRRKTGMLICAALRLGGLAAGADEEQLAALEGYGRAVGLAFQITDDLLDVAGTAEEVGKAVGKDAGRGKLTFPAVFGIDRSRQYVQELLVEAENHLARFGERREKLRMVARFLRDRNR